MKRKILFLILFLSFFSAFFCAAAPATGKRTICNATKNDDFCCDSSDDFCCDFVAKNEEKQTVIIMYHSVLKSRQNKYICSPIQIENDIKRFIDEGYRFVLPADLIAYADGICDLPNKTVMLTFDDGHYNFLYYVLPILERYGAKAVVSVVGAFCESSEKDAHNPNYSYLTAQDLKIIAANPLVSIANHTFDMHKTAPRHGAGRLKGETDEQYADALRRDLSKLQRLLTKNCGVTPDTFTYPFGNVTKIAQKQLPQLGFKVSLTCKEGVSTIKKGDKTTLFDLKRINRSGFIDTDALFTLINNYVNALQKNTQAAY